MKTKILRFFTGTLAAFLLFFSYSSCEIGLGSAVDVQAPGVSIETPEVDKVIRDAFAIGGTWSDDGSIMSIDVVLKRTDGKTLDGVNLERTIPATFNIDPVEPNNKKNVDTGTWEAVVYPLDSTSPIVDGTYQATVFIKDRGNHTSSQSTTFTIDNTKPIVVLTRPSTSDKSAASDTYGQTFTLEGQAADSNNVSLIEVEIYKDPECTPESYVHTVPLKNVPNSINMDVAKFVKGNTENDYYKIYGHSDTDSGAQTFYCKVVAYDGSERFPIDGVQTEEDKKGNAVDYYYLYKDIATDVLQNYKITEVYSIFNGTFSETSASRSVTTEDVLDVLESKKITKGKFTLNPKNNPTFTVTGRSPIVLGEGAFEGTTANITNGSQVVFEVSPGLDGILLNEETIRVYAQKCDDRGTIDTTSPLIDLTTTPQESGTSYKYITSVGSDKGFVIGNNYIIWVDGEDYASVPNKIEASGGVTYGFHMSASGMAPVLDVTTPARTPEYSNKSKQTFKGTINVEEGLPTLKITADGVPYEIKTFDKKEVLTNEIRYTFEWEAPEFTDAQGKGTHDFTFQAVLEGKSQLIERTIVYDTEKPIIEDIKISEAKKYDSSKEDGTVLEGRYLNGIITASVGISDEYDSIKTASYKIIINDDEASAQEVNIPNPARFQFPHIDTTNYADNSKFTIKITATDRAGNTQTHSEDFIIDQSTDVPVVWPRNSDEISLKNTTVSYYKTGTDTKKGVITAGSNLELKLYDDDGTDKNKLQISIAASTKLSSDSDIQSAAYNPVTDYSIIDDVLSFKIPDDGGFYCYKIIVTDIANNKSNELTPFVINAARAAATVTNIAKTPSYIRNAAGEKFEITIEGVSSLGPYQLYRKIGENNDFEWIKETDDFPITDEIELTAANEIAEGTKVYYYVQDSTPRDSNKEKYIDLKFDNDPPEVTITSPKTNKVGVNALSEVVPFSGRASDAKSGVAKLFYKFSKTKINSPATDGTTGGYTETSAVNGPWELDQVTFKEGYGSTTLGNNELDEGTWFFYVYAQDAAGNNGDVNEVKFDINLNEPKLETEIITGENCKQINGAYYFNGDLTGTLTASDTGGPVTIDLQVDNHSVFYGYSNGVFDIDGTTDETPFTESTQQTLTVIVTDRFGKTKSKSFYVYKDTTVPVLSVTNPGNQDSNSVTISGTVNDLGVGVASVLWSASSNGTYSAVSNFTAGNPNWSHTINLGTEQGSKTYYFKAVDKIGNLKTESVTFTYDNESPEITIGGDFTANKSYFKTSDFTLTGSASDSYQLNRVSIVQDNTEIEDDALLSDGATWKKEFTLGTGSGKLPDGDYTFKISAYDSVGKQSTVITRNITVDTVKPAVTLNGLPSNQDKKNKNYTFTGTASDATSGVSKVELTISDTDGHSKKVTVDGTTRWSYSLDCTSSEWSTVFASQGEKTLYICATDEAGLTSDSFEYPKESGTYFNQTSNKLTFVYDYEDPVLSVDTSTIRSFMPESGLTITGKAQDSYKLKELKITQNYGNTKTITFGAGTDEKSWSVGIPFNNAGTQVTPSNGQEYSYTFELYDSVGNKVAQYSSKSTADFDAPELTITAPKNKTGTDAVNETNYQMKGTFDESNIDGIYYQVLAKTASTPAAPSNILKASDWTTAGWTSISLGTANWSFYQKFKAKTAASGVEGLEEGNYKVYLYAVDGAGNISTLTSEEFAVDMASPLVSVDAAVLSTYNTKSTGFTNNKGSFTFTGTASDSNGIASVVISDGTHNYTPNISNGTYTATFNYGSGNTAAANYLADGTYTFTVTATDVVGKTSVITRNITIDTIAPTLSNILVNGAASSADKWYNTSDMKFTGSVQDNTGGSGVSEVVYKTSEKTGNTWSDWSEDMPFIGTDSWRGTISEVTSEKLKIKIIARDNAGNEASEEVGPWKIDTNPPSLVQVEEGSTTLDESTAYYSNGNNPITLKISAADGDNESGVDRVYVLPYAKLSAATVIDANKAQKQSDGTFQKSITPTTTGAVYARIYDNAGNYNDVTLFTITFDNKKPVLQSYNLSQVANGKTSSAYKKDATTYYVNPDDKTFTLSGIATDNLAVASVNVTMKVGSTQKDTKTVEDGEYSFTGIDMSGWGVDGTRVDVTITVTDKAGNNQDPDKSVAQSFAIIFDKQAPQAQHWVDTKNKDVYFRIGNADNDKKDNTHWETGDTVNAANNALNEDVGKKYSYGTWGNDSSIEIRGTFAEAASGSGLKEIHYAIFDAVPTAAQITAFENGTLTVTEDNHVKLINSFAPLAPAEEKHVPYNVAITTENPSGKASKIVDSNFKVNLSGFNADINYLVLVAEDNAGNRALDTLAQTEGSNLNSNWNSQNHDTATPYYIINKDTQAPSITAGITEGAFTNGTGDIKIAGTAKDVHSGLSKVIVRIENNDGEVVTINGKEETEADLTKVNDGKDLSSWELTITDASIFASDTYTVYAKATDNAGVGNSKQVSAGTITVDKTRPGLDSSSITLTETKASATQNAYKADSTYYINNTTTAGKTFKLSGLATDDLGVQKVIINITNTASSSNKIENQEVTTSGSWSYTISGWETWTGGATISIDAFDKAGNNLTTPVEVAVVFDTIAPGIDAEKILTPSATQTESTIFKFEGDTDCVTHVETGGSGFDKVDIAFTTDATAPAAAQTTASVDANGKWAASVEFANTTTFGSVFSSQGDKYIWIKPYDHAGNAADTWTYKKFVYDTATPTISFTTSSGSTNPGANTYRKAGFTLEVTADDTYGVKKVELLYGTNTVDITSSASSKKYSKAFKVGAETGNNTLLADGDYEFTIRVTDNADKTNEVTRSFSIDTTKPAVSAQSVTTSKNYSADGKNWYKNNQLSVSVTVKDEGSGSSGLASVQIATDAAFGQPSSLLKSDNNVWTGSIVCSEPGLNTIYIKAADSAGNINTEKSIPVYIDNTPPEAPVFLGAGPEGSIASASDITSLLVNPTLNQNIIVYGALIDAGENGKKTGITTDATEKAFMQKGMNGASAIETADTIRGFTHAWEAAHEYSEGNIVKKDSAIYLCKTLHTSGSAFADNYWADITNYSFWSYTIEPDDMVNGGINFTVKDNATNTADYVLFQMVVDKKAPTVTPDALTDADSEVAGKQINGIISISGIASDENGLSTTEQMKLYYTTDTTLGTATATPVAANFGDTPASKWKQIAATSPDADNKWSFDNINTAKLDGTTAIADETSVYFLVEAKDKAGNVGYSARNEKLAVKVDQDSDRPLIKFTNLTLGAMSATSPLPFETSDLYGLITDDDGISTIHYMYSDTDPAANAAGWTVLNHTNGSFTLTMEDGTRKLYFKIVDNKNNTFISSATDAYSQSTPKLKDSAATPNKYGYRSSDTNYKRTVTYLKVDTRAPWEGSLQFTTKASPQASDWQAKSEINSMPFGGPGERKTLKIRIPAWDANGISSVTMTLPGYGTDGTISFTDSSENAGNSTYTAATYWISPEIDVSSLSSENKSCTITVSDGVKTSSDDFVIAIDNTAPVISASNPSSTQYSSGSVIAYGETDLTYWKNTTANDHPREFMYYALSLDDATTPADDFEAASSNSAATITSWKDENGTEITNSNKPAGANVTLSYKPYYTPIKGGSFNWYVYFDGASSTDIESHDITFRQFLINSGVTTQEAIETTDQTLKFKTKVKAYIWIKAVDQVGNTTVMKHAILIDPQGDAPSVTIDYPETDGTTLGGAVTLRGTANDTKGTTPGIDSVWVQIISSKDYNYDSSSVTTAGTHSQTCGGFKFDDIVTISDNATAHAYTLTSFTPKIKDVKQWIAKGYKVYTNITNASPTSVTQNPAGQDSEDASNYYIMATFSGSAWNLKINNSSEFNPPLGRLNPIAYRVFAKDKDNNLSSYEEQLSVYDSDTPVISNLYLRQYDTDDQGNIRTDANGHDIILASRAYEDSMWVKGDWWLCGTVKDTQGIKELFVGPDTDKDEITTITHNPDTAETFIYKLETGEGVGNLKIIIEASDRADPVHTVKKECLINYDNVPPELVTSGANYKISQSVRNENGFYSFGSQVTENPEGNNNSAQSGFDYLAFWFERNITGKHVVYDVMRAKADSEINYASLSSDSGLMWKSVTVDRSEDALGTLTVTAKDNNIHAGGLCKIGGSIYIISSVSSDGKTIGINGQPEYSTASEIAYFAIANVVNNSVESGSGEKSTADGTYGYYTSMSNDDGDHMIESVSNIGTTWTWQANINAQNMKDGDIILNYVAFDKAGNYQSGSVTGQVANNAPRLASLTVWSDFNENTTPDPGESETKYLGGKERKILGVYGERATKVTDSDTNNTLVVSGNDKDYDDAATLGSAFMTVKATTRFIPEIVGGNGALYYTYKYGNAAGLASATVSYGATTIGNGTDHGIDEDIDANGYNLADDNGSGYINGSTASYVEIPGTLAGETDGSYTLNKIGNSTSATDPTWFEYTIYDSTEGSGTWNANAASLANRLPVTFRVALNVQYQDAKSPSVKIRPFYWESASKNSVSWDSSGNAEGHIELEGDLTTDIINLPAGTGNNPPTLGSDDPKVSGKIKVEGYAFDDIKLKYLYAQFAGHTALNTAKLASTYTGTWSTQAYANGWGFEAEDVYCNGNGHLVHWTLTVDTAARTSVAALNQAVVVYAVDARGAHESTHSTNPQPAQTTYATYIWGDVKGETNANTLYYTDIFCNTRVNNQTPDTTVVYKDTMTYYYKMDIVPYITKIYTGIFDTAGDGFARSATGRYIVKGKYRKKTANGNWNDNATETVKVYGFNLAVSVPGTNNTTINSTASKGTLSAGNTDALGSYLNLAIGNSTTSGALSITVNNISSLNNINKNPTFVSATDDTITAYEYNSQANGITNNRLTDDVELWVWDLGYFVTSTSKIYSPMMKMDSASNYYMAYGLGTDQMMLRENTSPHIVDTGYNKFINTAVAFSSDGKAFGMGTCTDRIDNSSASSVFYTWRTTDLNPTNKGQEYTYSRTGKYHLEKVFNRSTGVYDTDRVQRPKMEIKGASTDAEVYMVYYDKNNQILPIKFRYGKVSGTTEGDVSTTLGLEGVSSRYTNTTNVNSQGAVTTQNNNPTQAGGSGKNFQIVASNTTTYKSGPYTAVGYTTTGKAVVAWYDSINRQLVYSYNDAPQTTDATGVVDTWQGNAVVIDDEYAGWYVDLKVDANNAVHIAYYSSKSGDLKYAYISSYDGARNDDGSLNTSNVKVVTVDSYLSVGTNISINTRLEDEVYVPYIYYYNTSNNQTCNSIKVAWQTDLTTLRDGAINDKFTGAWESMTVPVQNIPLDATVCGGVPTSGTYANSVVLGYMSDEYYERANIK